MNKNHWTRGGNYEQFLYREDFYDDRFYVRPVYNCTKIVRWRACDRSKSNYTTGNSKTLLEARNKKTVMDFMEKNLESVDAATKILIPNFISPYVEIMLDEKRGWKWKK